MFFKQILYSETCAEEKYLSYAVNYAVLERYLRQALSYYL